MRDFFHVLRTDGQAVEKLAPNRVGAKRIVHGKHDPVDPTTCCMQRNGGVLKYPLVVKKKCSQKYSPTERFRLVAARPSTDSERTMEKGRFSPMCPIIIFSLGKRSNTPATINLRLCMPVSTCQPQPAVERSTLASLAIGRRLRARGILTFAQQSAARGRVQN